VPIIPVAKSQVKQSVRYSPAAASVNMRNQTSSPKNKNMMDINSVSLNISELYKQYSKKQGSNMLNNTQIIYPNKTGGGPNNIATVTSAGNHFRAISVLDQNQMNTTITGQVIPTTATHFSNRHGSSN
jgi:hypothetical protein